MQIMLLIAVFFGYFSIALALPLENSIKNVFFRGMYTAEVCILSPTDILRVVASEALIWSHRQHCTKLMFCWISRDEDCSDCFRGAKDRTPQRRHDWRGDIRYIEFNIH